MNKLEKFFNTLSSSTSKLLKKYTTEELTGQIKEYVDFTPYIVKNVYKLLVSQNSDDRINGSEILRSLMFQFKLVTDFKIEYKDNKEEYLGSTGEEYETKKIKIDEQKKLLKEIAGLQHVDTNLVTEIDFKSDDKFIIKKQKLQDKNIENVNDFFTNLTNNLLSYEWNKRHGAFLAYCAIFDSETNGDLEIKVDSTLFLKIYEILKSDKFTDFVDDQVTAPVREAAALLLGEIYPRIPKNNIINELVKFLDDKDWQTQYSGLLALKNLKKYILDKKQICDKLQNLLNCKDEDVKFLSAEILIYFFEFCDKEIVYKKCIENLKDDEEIGISKVTLISLLSKFTINIKDISFLFNYFTSPIAEVRKSVLNLSKNIQNDSIDFLLGELILLDEKNDIRDNAIEILQDKKITNNFINHFLLIIGNSLYSPYNTNLFVSYDDVYFTKSGIKSIGKNVILNNRVKLFNILIEKVTLDKIEYSPNTMIGDIFLTLLKSINKKNNLCINNEDSIKRTKIDENFYDFFEDIKLLPKKELENKIKNPEKLSLHPFGESVYSDYLRWITIKQYPVITENIINYYKYETSYEFLDFFTNMLIKDFDKKLVNLDELIFNGYKFLLEGYENFLLFFKKFEKRIFSHFFYNNILSDEKRYDFFSKTICFYRNNLKDLNFLYVDALSLEYVDILKGFLIDFSYLEDFFEKMLQSINMNLLVPLISFVDHSYYPLLVKPLLKLMSSSENQEKASFLISYIIPRLNFKMNSSITKKWIDKICECKKDLECLLDNKKIEKYEIKCPTKIVLRSYQQEGIKWINFLYKFNLNGILADDMGLGKTIQVLSFICSEMYKTDKKALVICPSSLTGHWFLEITNYFPDTKPFCYKRNRNEIYDVLIISYDSYRNDFEFLIDKDWFYVILDEGHVLRNSNTLLYQRISKLKCKKRLILTGTPVHNSVEDLVSLFNLLMPNYLEKEVFNMSNKMTDKELQDIKTRLDNLNRKILPFILRRLKVDVLKDLPPKIIRDITVEMGPEQKRIYNDCLSDNFKIEKIDNCKSLVEERGSINDMDVNNYKDLNSQSSGLKKTKDLLNIASHISYVKSISELSCKFKGLEDIINLYGGDDIKNKILIFFQYKSTIDFVIEDFKKKFNLKYLRLDGSVPSSKRAKIASDFNLGNIPILFLTTHVGGLGLNLTGADTVVFYEHDWNPFNDLQAMDRAHRIGQKNTVNVFRLITKNSIEERVMSLQNFKMFIASSIVTQQNSDIETMNVKDLLERFNK